MNVDRININIGGLPSTGFNGDEREFENLERLAGGHLPASYRELMKRADGGHPEIGCFRPLGSGVPGNLFSVDWFYSLANPAIENVRVAFAMWSSLLGEKTLPLGADGGGNQIYLQLSEAESSVWLYLHDEGGKRVKIANNLEDFIDSLELNPDFI